MSKNTKIEIDPNFACLHNLGNAHECGQLIGRLCALQEQQPGYPCCPQALIITVAESSTDIFDSHVSAETAGLPPLD